MIPGLELVPLEESEICCGAAGTYNLTQPEMSERLGRRKMDRIEATGAEVVATGNVGCILQIARKIKERGSPIEVAHPVDLLDRAYGPIDLERRDDDRADSIVDATNATDHAEFVERALPATAHGR